MTRSLRVAVFVYEFPALSETFVLNQITGLIDLGHDVTILAERPRPESRVHPDIDRYGLGDRVRYPGFPASRFKRVLRAVYLFLRHGRRHGRMLRRCLDRGRYGRDAVSLTLFYWALRLAEEPAFDVVLCHFGPNGQFATKLRDVGALSGQIATVFHGVDISAYLRVWPDYYDFLFSHGDLFLPISGLWKRKLSDLGCDPGRIMLHRMGVDAERYAFRPRQFPSDRPVRILSVGRMIEKKGIGYGLQATAELARKDVAFRYDIVGDGPLRGDLERLVEELGLTPFVHFHGWQDQRAVSKLIAGSDILLAPSVTSSNGDKEGIPVTIMEAMASGALVVSTYHSGIPELVEHERSGLLVPERDVNALSAALFRLVRFPDDWPGLSYAARRKVLAGFEVTALNRRLSDLLIRLAEDKPADPAAARTGTRNPHSVPAAPQYVHRSRLFTD